MDVSSLLGARPRDRCPNTDVGGRCPRGPLKNDVSISMLILGRAEKKRVFLKSRRATTAPSSTPGGAGLLPGESGAGPGLRRAEDITQAPPPPPPSTRPPFGHRPGLMPVSNGLSLWGLPAYLPSASEIEPPKLLHRNCAEGTLPTEVQRWCHPLIKVFSNMKLVTAGTRPPRVRKMLKRRAENSCVRSELVTLTAGRPAESGLLRAWCYFFSSGDFQNVLPLCGRCFLGLGRGPGPLAPCFFVLWLRRLKQ